MDNLTEIKEKLDIIYQECEKNKSQFGKKKAKVEMTAKLVVEMTVSNDVKPTDIAFELSRFPSHMVDAYFKSLTKSATVPLEVMDEVLKELYAIDKEAKLSHQCISKYAFAIIAIMNHYKENVVKSTQLPVFVAFIAQFAVRPNKNREKFQKLINDTSGDIYMLDYADIERQSLTNIWDATKAVFPNLSESKFEAAITEWGKKYGFIQENMNKASFSQTLYDKLKRNMDKEQEAIIMAFSDMITPISKAFETIQGEINKSRDIGAENVLLKAKIADLERQLTEQRTDLQTANQSLICIETENGELKKQISSLEIQISDLDGKLNDAYEINSRASSLEAEKIRSELKKAFAFLYEDWLEYEFSDVSEDNYASLQAIIKKIFRSLERSGIDFKRNNE
jgi:hypothetical protein